MQILLSVLTIVIAGAVAWIGYQQHELAKEKFKLDMFEKRFAVYQGAQRFLTHILQEAKMELDKHSEFRRDTQDAMFLFGQDIPEYLKQLDEQALAMWAITQEYSDMPEGKERSELCKRKAEMLKNLIAELPKLKEVFAPYLRFSQWR